jgi:spore maturation protein CgeB
MMKIVVFGLSITSSWGNGHATTFRALFRALHSRGHKITFFEKDLEWYASNRDLPQPDFCQVRLFENWEQIRPIARRELANCDVAMVGSYFPDGIAAMTEMLESAAPVKTFYDIDTPITVATLRKKEQTDYVEAAQLRDLDVYFSFTGGPMLREIETGFKVRQAVPLYCSFDPDRYHPMPASRRYQCDLSYMGTYAFDRQPKIDQLLVEVARKLPDKKFIVAGPQYPKTIKWPLNLRRITHLNQRWHPHFYSSSRFTLNVTRRDMVVAGYSPSVRLFEAAACGAAMISDNWPGLDTFFKPGSEILLPAATEDAIRYVIELSDQERRSIGRNAMERVLAEHTSEQRATEFEAAITARESLRKNIAAEISRTLIA